MVVSLFSWCISFCLGIWFMRRNHGKGSNANKLGENHFLSSTMGPIFYQPLGSAPALGGASSAAEPGP